VIIAIDGPAASGKGTLAKRIATYYDFEHLDSGLLYRAVAKAVLEAGGSPDDKAAAIAAARTFDPDRFPEDVLKGDDVAKAASYVAAVPEVRAELVAFQRTFAKKKPGVVIDGRDIGTVIAPDADVKLFVTASIAARAMRRWQEMQARGAPHALADIEADLHRRDERDRTRAEAPLRAADDAMVLDTSDLSADLAIAAAIAAVDAALRGP
jgi:cytidylate kinase